MTELAEYDAYYAQDTTDKVIYLTFDAGYENGNTAPILDALKKHNAPATFFVVGTFIKENPDLVRRMNEEGHIVGNHTSVSYTHLFRFIISLGASIHFPWRYNSTAFFLNS